MWLSNFFKRCINVAQYFHCGTQVHALRYKKSYGHTSLG